ncbi:MAG: DUF3565 domain-containing protein [Actinomycetia bacterium]|nr:DUF3565 domain-containing protein [Actinomycetes bacterium]MCP4086245.1 DUF3565 domain-containing protein [Actinomycetes bacterium]
MDRTVTGFRTDGDDGWVAILDCHHGRHVRHHPPWPEGPWAQTEEGRQSMLGTVVDCPKCERIEMPDGLVHDRTTAEWNEDTLPRAVRRDHKVAGGVWGQARVIEGSIRFGFADGLGGEISGDGVLETGDKQPIPPNRPHHLEVIGPVRVVVDFFVMTS